MPKIVLFVDGFGEFNGNKCSIPELFHLENQFLVNYVKVIVACQQDTFISSQGAEGDLQRYLTVKGRESATLVKSLCPIADEDICKYFAQTSMIMVKNNDIFPEPDKVFDITRLQNNCSAASIRAIRNYPLILQYIYIYLLQSSPYYSSRVAINQVKAMNDFQ